MGAEYALPFHLKLCCLTKFSFNYEKTNFPFGLNNEVKLVQIHRHPDHFVQNCNKASRDDGYNSITIDASLHALASIGPSPTDGDDTGRTIILLDE